MPTIPAVWASRLAGPPKSKSLGAMIATAPLSIICLATLPTVTGSLLPSMFDELDLLAENAAVGVELIDGELRAAQRRLVERSLDAGLAQCRADDDRFRAGLPISRLFTPTASATCQRQRRNQRERE